MLSGPHGAPHPHFHPHSHPHLAAAAQAAALSHHQMAQQSESHYSSSSSSGSGGAGQGPEGEGESSPHPHHSHTPGPSGGGVQGSGDPLSFEEFTPMSPFLDPAAQLQQLAAATASSPYNLPGAGAAHHGKSLTVTRLFGDPVRLVCVAF